MAKVYVGSARGDERGRAYGGAAGDQTGREVSKQLWYRHEKGWRTLRAKDEKAREKLAAAMEAACGNGNIGYDQWQRDSLMKEAGRVGYDIAKVTKACETDCSSLVRVCCAYAFGRDVVPEVSDARFYTGNLVPVLLKTGLFEELEGDVYSQQSDYLMRGDIQCTRVQGHVVIVLDNGKHAGEVPVVRERTLRRGMSGEDVREMQRRLALLGYALGKWGADGKFGAATEAAVRAFQKDAGLEADGIIGEKTRAALKEKAGKEMKYVLIGGGNCHVRTGPGKEYESIGVAMEGNRLEYAGETGENGWLKVMYAGREAWVSGKYGRLEAAV